MVITTELEEEGVDLPSDDLLLAIDCASALSWVREIVNH